MTDELILIIDGKPHRGWTSASVSRSIERGPHEFDATLTNRWDVDATAPRSVQAGMTVEAAINDDLVLTGYIDDVDPEYDDKSHTIVARGRSKLADLVDCSTTGTAAKGRSLAQLATQLAKPFGIAVEVDALAAADANKPFSQTSDLRLDNGETIWEFLEELARMRAVLLTSTAAGNLRIVRAGTAGRADTALELGVNIKAASGSFSHRELFSDYIVTGQQQATAFIGAKDTTQPRGVAKGSGRYRPKVFMADTPADIANAKQRAEWQRNVHQGRSQGVVYTVSGWRQTPGGRLWMPNEIVHIKDEWMGLDADRLVVESRILLDEGGSRSEIRVMPKEAFLLDALPESSSAGLGFIL